MYTGQKENYCQNCIFSLLKAVKQKGTKLLPMGANSFLLEYNPLQKGTGVLESKQEAMKVVFLVKQGGKSTKFIHSPSYSINKGSELMIQE